MNVKCTCSETLCAQCAAQLEQDLIVIAGSRAGERSLMRELEITTTRQNVEPRDPLQVGGSNSDETPILFDDEASEAGLELKRVMRLLRFRMQEHYPHLNCVTSHPTDVAKWLLLIPGLLAEHPEIVRLAAAVRNSVYSALRAIDDPPAKMFLGPCPDCGKPLFIAMDVTEEGVSLECPDRLIRCCGEAMHAPALRESLIGLVKDRVATAKESVRLVNDLTGPEAPKVSTRDLQRWRKGGLLKPRGKDARGSWVYRVGDITWLVSGQ